MATKIILLIEDDLDLLRETSETLQLAGYQVCTASNGKEGIKMALAHQPDLIISGVNMPVMDGYGVLHLVQKTPELANIPFIFITSQDDRDDIRRGMEMGADDYITKPFSDSEILNSVESRFKRLHRLKKQAQSSLQIDFTDKYNREHTIKELFKSTRHNIYKKKQIVFAEDNYPQYLFYIHKGKVKAFKTSDEGKELTVGLYAEGDFIGYTALLEESTYRVSTKTLESCDLLLIPKDEFYTLINSNNALAMQFIKLIAHKNNQKADLMVQLAYSSLRKRVANSLLFLKRKFTLDTDERFTIHLTREELANISGTTTESLIRTLSDFRDEKLIKITNREIEILDIDSLRNMVN